MSDYLPKSDRELVDMLQNLGTRLAAVVATFNLTAADATAVTTDATSLRTLVLDQADKENAAKAATAAKVTARTTISKRTRALVRRLKAHANYTAALGEQLGIVAADAGTSGGGAAVSALSAEAVVLRPNLRTGIGSRGEITVGFVKRGHTGIMLYGRRSGEPEWVLLSKQLHSPCVDERPNLSVHEPETREYRAAYFDGDTAVGQLSDTRSITVPGIGFTDAELGTAAAAAAATAAPQTAAQKLAA